MTAVASKRDAHLVAQAEADRQPIPTACVDASGARIRTVGVHLTPFAPHCEGLSVENRKRWAVLHGVSPERAVRATLKRLNRSPRAVRLQAFDTGVDVLSRPTVATLHKVADAEQDFAPFAHFTDGLTLAEAQAALDALIASGWEPSSSSNVT